jgi:hypothetical protein
MIGNNGLLGAQRITRRGFKICSYAGDADESWIPTDSSSHQQPVLRGKVLQDFAELSLEPFSGHANGGIE